MKKAPESVTQFLEGKRIAVAGVSRHGDVAANAVFRKLRDSGYEVFPVNPNADKVENVPCYPDIASVPGKLDGVVIATHPDISASIVRQCNEHGVNRVWFHRSFGDGSVSNEALNECERLNMEYIVGGCPLMYCEPIDFGHKCMHWWLHKRGRIPTS
jgi:predicted CoA-binding protein